MQSRMGAARTFFFFVCVHPTKPQPQVAAVTRNSHTGSACLKTCWPVARHSSHLSPASTCAACMRVEPCVSVYTRVCSNVFVCTPCVHTHSPQRVRMHTRVCMSTKPHDCSKNTAQRKYSSHTHAHAEQERTRIQHRTRIHRAQSPAYARALATASTYASEPPTMR